jgi:predicted transcriptional regulator
MKKKYLNPLSIRIKPEIDEALNKRAHQEDRSKSYLINKILGESLNLNNKPNEKY